MPDCTGNVLMETESSLFGNRHCRFKIICSKGSEETLKVLSQFLAPLTFYQGPAVELHFVQGPAEGENRVCKALGVKPQGADGQGGGWKFLQDQVQNSNTKVTMCSAGYNTC